MSIANSLNSALSGLAVNARRADVASSNIANALTDGYGRRVLEVSSHSSGSYGSGVQIDGVRRISDPVILADRRIADGAAAANERRTETLAIVESAIGGPDSQDGLAARFMAVESALIAGTADPASEIRLERIVHAMSELTKGLNQASTVVQSERVRADAEIEDAVAVLNRSFERVRELNDDIGKAVIARRDPSALIDERQIVIDKIAEIVPVKEVARPHGRIALWSTGGMELVDGRARKLNFDARATITPEMTMSSGGLSGISVAGELLGNGGIGRLTGGRLEALFELRDQSLVNHQKNLDDIAQDLLTRFSDQEVDPTLSAGEVGLFRDSRPLVPLRDPTGIAQRLMIDPRLGSLDSAEIWRVRTGLNASEAGEPGETRQLLRYLDSFSRPRSLGSGDQELTTFERIVLASETASSEWYISEEKTAFSSAKRDTLREAEIADGVNTDAELQALITVEQAYAANARVLEVVEQMMRRVMEI